MLNYFAVPYYLIQKPAKLCEGMLHTGMVQWGIDKYLELYQLKMLTGFKPQL